MTLNKYFTILILCLIGHVGFSQDSFHRSYPTNKLDNIHLLDGAASAGGTYYILGALLSEDLSEYESLVLASFTVKGDLNWQKQLEGIPTSDFGAISGHMTLNDAGDITYSISFMDDTSPYRLIGNVLGDGTIETHRTYGLNSSFIPGNIEVINFKDNSYLQSGAYQGTGNAGIYIGSVDFGTGSFNWINGMTASDTLGNDYNYLGFNSNLKSDIDSSILFGGSISVGTNNMSQPFLNKMDSTGMILWSKVYNSGTSDVQQLVLLDHYETADSSIIVSGIAVGNSFSNGFVARLDAFGEVIWGKRIDLGATISAAVDNITVNEMGEIIAAGRGLNSVIDTTYDFHIKMDENGAELLNAQFDAAPSFFFPQFGDLFSTSDGGTIYFSTGLEGDEFVPMLIKTNPDLVTSCEDTLDMLIISDLMLTSDTLIWSLETIDTVITEIEVVDTAMLSFNVPVLSLESVPFCPDEPIDHTFKPEVEGATSYLWSTGAMSDTLRVTEEGDYSVTITVGEKVCFTLCDTGRISQYERPEIDVQLNLGPFCETGQQILFMQYIMDAPISAIEWSTGEMNVDNILISEVGTYRVTVTDICEEQAEKEINVNEFPELLTEVTVDVDDDFCANNGIRLTANVNGTPGSSFWSDGSAGLFTTVLQAGDYTVTVTDVCGTPYEANATVTPSMIVAPITNLIVAPIGGNCILGELELNAAFSGTESGILWSTGETSQVITVTAPGTYQVSVENECGNAVSSAPLVLEECPECITYPKVFFPRGMEELNKTFGPILNCGDVITDYELKIFNRWGNLVFESTDVGSEWNGNRGGSPSPSGVYVYFAKYNAGAGEQITEGDVTLLR